MPTNVEDLESLNGTYVNGERIVRKEVSLDSQIAFISADGAVGRTFEPIGQTMMTETVHAFPRDSLI